jgi:hypothetical protein
MYWFEHVSQSSNDQLYAMSVHIKPWERPLDLDGGPLGHLSWGCLGNYSKTDWDRRALGEEGNQSYTVSNWKENIWERLRYFDSLCYHRRRYAGYPFENLLVRRPLLLDIPWPKIHDFVISPYADELPSPVFFYEGFWRANVDPACIYRSL